MMNPIENPSINDTISLEYELVEISFDQEHSTCCRAVYDDSDVSYGPAECDDNGIPLGQSMDDIRKREQIISQFFHQWSELHPERSVLNSSLNEMIHIKGKSIAEMMQHSSKRYKSTLAVLHFETVLKGATTVDMVPTKKGNNKQKEFDHMLIMSYQSEELGLIKVTIGVKKSNSQKVQYGMTSIDERKKDI